MTLVMMNCNNVMLACTCLLVVMVTVSALGKYGFDRVENSLSGIPDKRMTNPACYSCMHDSMDMVSCSRCFGGFGTVPFYGSFAKRDYSNYPMVSSEAEENYMMMKRGPANFLVCRCCMYLESWGCCYNCAFGVYYGKRSMSMANTAFPMSKRNYFTSFEGMNGGSGTCSCCESETFDFACCVTRCSRRRRK